MKRYVSGLSRLLKTMVASPVKFARTMNSVSSIQEAHKFAQSYSNGSEYSFEDRTTLSNPLWEYFQNHKEGPGIWKWKHYFEIYHRHFARFVGTKVNVLEIGIYSGGSLGMWRAYFGDDSHIFGVDIEPACKSYESKDVTVFIGDQGDREFWRKFKGSVAGIDILIDDGGHTPEQQQITLEEMLPFLRPGGVYLCEDINGATNRFTAFAAALVDELNGINGSKTLSDFQSTIHSIHFYPYVVVIEKHLVSPKEFSAPKHGTEWQPY